MKFGEKLKALRLERNLSQKALADLSGITVRTIQNYETTDMLPKRRDTYDMLARALGVENRVGSLEKGKDADVVIWTADPLSSIGGEAYITVINGRIVWRRD